MYSKLNAKNDVNNKRKKNSILIDCTLRDGGYYNKWDFDIDLINKYINAVSAAGIDFIELGFRSINKNEYFGPLAYTTDNFLYDLDIPDNIQIGVMINASDFRDTKLFKNNLVELFPINESESKLSLVRIATSFRDIDIAIKIGKWLKDKRYKIAINIMQVASLNSEQIEYFSEKSGLINPEVLFFADSTGTLTHENIIFVINAIKSKWRGDIGIHAHDNMQRALTNTLDANANGVKWLDCTVNGMGRGPGNTKTEDLVCEIKEINDDYIDFLPLIDIVQNDFFNLKQKYKWGSNPFYYLSGKNKIHPSYIQNMLEDTSYRNEDIYASIKELSKCKSTTYFKKVLDNSRIYYKDKHFGEWSPKEVFFNKEVLLLAPGASIKKHKKSIEKFIIKKKPLVVALNNLDLITDELINYRIACHPIRIFSDLDKYKNFSQPLILPLKSLIKWSEIKINFKVLDYGLSVETNKFEFNDKSCIVPAPLVMAYALAMCNSGEVEKIYLVGFDGYKRNDFRERQVKEIWDIYSKFETKKVISLTETIYNIEKSSIYSFI